MPSLEGLWMYGLTLPSGVFVTAAATVLQVRIQAVATLEPKTMIRLLRPLAFPWHVSHSYQHTF